MSVVKEELKTYATTNIPSDNTSTGGGAIDTVNEITDGQTAKIWGSIPAPAEGASDAYYYGKVHYKNTNVIDDLSSSKTYCQNLLDNPSVTGILKAITVASGDNETKKVRFKGENSLGTPDYEDVTCPASPGTIVTTKQFLLNRIVKVELLDVITELASNSAGDITIYDANDTELGKIPSGFNTATGEVTMGVASTLDDTTTIANRLTAPAGIVFSKARNITTALTVANAGVLTHAKDQAIWLKLTLQDGMLPPVDGMQLCLAMNGRV